MTNLYYHRLFLEHDTGRHPENARRLETVIAQLGSSGLLEKCTQPTWQPIALEQLRLVHSAEHIERIEQCSAAGGRLDPDTVCSNGSYGAARLASGAVVDAVDHVLNNETRQALCLVRPPGHHALADRAMGFCLFSNIAIGARLATEKHGVQQLLIVDWDVHHGNGTQEIFWEDSRVGFFSIHRWPFYPGSGAAAETGTGDALGTTRNVPIEFGTARSRYLETFAKELEEFAARIQPQLVMISAGFDAHQDDPVGSLGLQTEDFQALTDLVLDLAASYCDGKVVSVLEGGYNPSRLADCVEVHLECMLDRA